ncbi:MAG: hypothetical protein WA982_06115 [Rubrobacteraceae bacterium]
MEASTKEIHGHPLRPSGFAEPLFLGREDKKEIAEYLSRSNWLGKVSEASDPEARPCHVYRGASGEAWLVGPGCKRSQWRRRTRKRRVARVIERWREVRCWWEPEGGTDRLLFRVLLSGGVVADVALDRRYGWSLVRVLD